jgi:uncharacterized membrane protein YgcG
MMSMGRRLTAIGVVAFLAACGGHGKDAASASGSVADPLSSADEELPVDPPPAPPTATNAPAAATAPVAPPANCPIACAMLGPAGRSLAADDVATLRTSLAPTVASLHGCMGDTGGRYVRAPALLARFAESGELLDMGVDSDGWSQGEQMCFDGVVHGGTQPQVAMQGRATVRCSETCGARHGRGPAADEPIYSHNVLQAAAAPAPTATQAPRPMRMGGGRGGGGGRSGGGGRGGGRGGGGSQ